MLAAVFLVVGVCNGVLALEHRAAWHGVTAGVCAVASACLLVTALASARGR